MDEIEEDDYNELEALLYAQIHHEAIKTENSQAVLHKNMQEESILNPEHIFNDFSVANNLLAQKDVANKGTCPTLKENSTSNALETAKDISRESIQPQKLDNANTSAEQESTSNAGYNSAVSIPKHSQFQAVVPKNPYSQFGKTTDQKGNSTSKFINPKKSVNSTNQDLRLNPAKLKKNQEAKKKQQNTKKNNAKEILKNGPFAQRSLKLEKAKRIAAKKKKSIDARKKRNQNRLVESETIILTSTDDDKDDDVEVVPMPSPPIFTIDDSDDDNKDNSLKQNIYNIEENAIDAADVDMNIIRTISTKDTSAENMEKSVDNHSRCNSPVSVQSSDDFIGSNNRGKFIKTNAEQANDVDLLLLTADVDSLMESASFTRPETQANNKVTQSRKNNESSNNKNSTEFLVPNPTSADRNIFCVKEKQYRAIDIYESESDINDGVYSKGVPKQTIIRELNSSDDDVTVPVERNNHSKAKRLRKRRASSSNKDSEPNNNDSTDSDVEGVEQTPVPGIVRGPAVEKRVSKPIKNVCPKTTQTSNESMIDNAFIESLNNLAQGGDDVENDDSSEEIYLPTARDIAEKVLQKNTIADIVIEHSAPATEPITIADKSLINEAIPDDGSVAKLKKIFNVIDKMDQNESFKAASKRVDLTSDNDDVLVTDSWSDKQLSTNQIVKSNNRNKQNQGKPCYNVCSANCANLWPEEMFKFYNCSWNGEHFSVNQTCATMRPNKNLWKISSKDRFPQSRPHKRVKCFNCCEFGHTIAACTRPRKPLVCFTCGESGHREPRCPNTICLRCGNKTLTFVKNCNACTFHDRLSCSICKVRGHLVDHCPDKWRRYHSTTRPDMNPDSQIVYNNRKFCCVCGRRGHLSETCRYQYLMEYPIVVTKIKSHQKTYIDLSIQRRECNLKVNLLYNPSKYIQFRFLNNTTESNCYTRFLYAVGLSHILKKRLHKSRLIAEKERRLKMDSNAPDQVQEVSESGNGNINSNDNRFTNIKNSNEFNTSAVIKLFDEDLTIEKSPKSARVVSANKRRKIINPNEDEGVDIPNNATRETVAITVDSDSNYSFSEHFATGNEANEINVTSKNTFNIEKTVASATKSCDDSSETNIPIQNIALSESASPAIEILKHNASNSLSNQIPQITSLYSVTSTEKTKSRPMDTLPDFIPLSSTTQKTKSRGMETLPDFIPFNTNKESNDFIIPTRVPQKRRYFCITDSNPDPDPSPNLNPNESELEKECLSEGMLCIPAELVKYLESKEGQKFLTETSKFHDVHVRLDDSAAGKSIFLFGLPTNQDRFHAEMLERFRNFHNDYKRHIENSRKVPKRIDVLIRFLRENLNQLMHKLGNVNILLERMNYHENQGSKTSNKLAEKERRLLNMILIGQAGLRNGNNHLDNLVNILKKLIHEYNSEGNASEELRDEIDFHWKLIFTPYRHNDYIDLVNDYNRLISKNRVNNINIDPVLLGHKVLDTNLSQQQKHQLEQPKVNTTTKDAKSNSLNIVPNPFNAKNSRFPNNKSQNATTTKKQHATTSKQTNLENSDLSTTTKFNTPSALSKKQKHIPSAASFKKPDEKSTVAAELKNVSQNWQKTCHNLLTELDDSKNRQGPLLDVTAASIFWSREAMKYLDDCVILSESNTDLLTKLKRVQNNSQNGLLSYNDYRAVIKLHTAMTGK